MNTVRDKKLLFPGSRRGSSNPFGLGTRLLARRVQTKGRGILENRAPYVPPSKEDPLRRRPKMDTHIRIMSYRLTSSRFEFQA